MSTSETAPLNPSGAGPELIPRDSNEAAPDMPSNSTLKKRRDPLYILILYGLSSLISMGALSCSIWGYSIIVSAPFDEQSKKWERAGYEKYFYGMQSIVILNAINMLYSGLNSRLALKGRQQSYEILWLVNMIYDFLLWATLIAFGVLNMIEMLWDRRLCDGLPRQEDGHPDKELYKKCDEAMFRLLVVEMVAVNLGLLVAVLHFILLIARCCTCGPLNRSWKLRERIQEEEEVLLVLMERRRRLMEDNEELEARRGAGDMPLPPVPAETHEASDEVEEEYLIDMAAEEQESSLNVSGDGYST